MLGNTRTGRAVALTLLLAVAEIAAALAPGPPRVVQEEAQRGDLAAIRARGVLRVLVPYDPINFFIDRGRPRGFQYELMRAYEAHANGGIDAPDRRLRVVFVPTARAALLDGLRQGRGDVVAAALSPPVGAGVVATRPYIPALPQVLVTRADRPVPSLRALPGRRVHALAHSGAAERLRGLSLRLMAQGNAPILVTESDAATSALDLLQGLEGGTLEAAVVPLPLARSWAAGSSTLVVHEGLVIGQQGLAWAVRQDNPALRAELDAFLARHGKGSLLGNVLYDRYFARNRWIGGPIGWDHQQGLQPALGLFREYGARYGFDWLALAAQAYQESHLRHDRISAAGAVGIMQVRPSTALDPRVGIDDIGRLENNVHAGVKYLHLLRERYFHQPELTPEERMNFIWAAYNAGPTRIQRLRREAARRGLDPNRWFGQVERVVAERVGRETVDYVANISKYYLAYRLARQQHAEAHGRGWRLASRD